MASIKTRKRFIYAVFSCIFLLGGIEYAVILPTLWLYLHNTYNAPDYMLGLVLSAYSVAAFFSSPVIGRISDKTGRTKAIFIFCACFQMAGSFLYFVGISEWLCVGSRFICGIGGAGEAVALAEVSRYTSEQERTGIISKLIATRQIALLAAPGLNIGLRLLHFNIGPFEVNKYTVPGAFMAVLWLVMMVIIVTIYSEPHEVYNEEMKQKPLASDDTSTQISSQRSDDLYDDIKQKEHENAPIVQVNNSVCNGIIATKDESPIPQSIKIEYNDSQLDQTVPTLNGVHESNEVMASAERYICSSELSNQQTSGEIDLDDSWSLIDAEEAPLLHKATDVKLASNNLQNSANDEYIENYESHIDDVIAREGKLGFFCKEYIKDNVMAILTLLFCAMFSQIALEAMCTQLSLEYLDFGEVENSVLYCLCGVEIILAFVVVSVLSKYVEDRKMILFGGVILLASNIWLMVFLPFAPKHDRSKNLLSVSIAVAMDVLSLPFLLVCATSLYSKMTRRETQGLSQGLRRAIVGLGTILAPLWASSVVSKPYLVLGVLIGIQSLAMLMCLVSYKSLKGLGVEANKAVKHTDDTKSTRPGNSCSSPTSDIQSNSPIIPQSTQYGSIDSTDSFACRYSAVRSQENV